MGVSANWLALQEFNRSARDCKSSLVEMKFHSDFVSLAGVENHGDFYAITLKSQIEI